MVSKGDHMEIDTDIGCRHSSQMLFIARIATEMSNEKKSGLEYTGDYISYPVI